MKEKMSSEKERILPENEALFDALQALYIAASGPRAKIPDKDYAAVTNAAKVLEKAAQ